MLVFEDEQIEESFAMKQEIPGSKVFASGEYRLGISGEYDVKRGSGELTFTKWAENRSVGAHVNNLPATPALNSSPAPAPNTSATVTAIAYTNPNAIVDGETKRLNIDQGLLGDPLLASVPRSDLNGKQVPSVGGILILSKISQGGMGTVYYGIHPRLDQEVAIKVLRMDLLRRDPAAVQRFIREARLAFSVRSQHLVGVLDINQENEVFYLVMEYVNGITARAFRKDYELRTAKQLPELVALNICIGATHGLEAAHRKNVIHRDVKPDNILIPYAVGPGAVKGKLSEFDFENIKLVDLGLARKEMRDKSSARRTTFGLGTLGFVAPEQTQDASAVGKPADIFGMGATLYDLLTGQFPERHSVKRVALLKSSKPVCESILKVRPDTSESIVKLLDRCFALQPECRPADATALLAELYAAKSKRKSMPTKMSVEPPGA